MWSPIFLCMLVGFSCAANVSPWKDNTEYVYQLRGRIFSSLHEVYNQYSGILTRATLRIQLRPDGNIQAVMKDPEYSQIHSQLHEGLGTYIPDAELTWKPLEVSSKPFQVRINKGIISDIIVEKNTPNWEANLIKGIMSQFQLNIGDFDNSNSEELPAVFKVMEDTVTGSTETLYEIKQVPEYSIESSQPWQQRLLELKGESEIIEVVKHKNYTENVELPAYFYGFGEMREFDSATNRMGGFFLRDSTSHAFLTGSRQRFTIHHSYTVNRIIVNPTLTDKQKGSVVSMVNVTLEEIKSKTQIIEDVVEPMSLGNIVYTYENPYSSDNHVSEKKPAQSRDEHNKYIYWRLRRSVDSAESTEESEENYKHKGALMSRAPACPLLPHTMGYKGQSVKQGMDIVKSVIDLAKEIGKELQSPREIRKQETVSKFISMASLMRVMNEEDLMITVNELYTTSDDRIARAAWTVLRDALAEVGTGPAFLVLEKLIETRKVQGLQASHLVSTMSASVRHPTVEYIKSFFELIKKNEVRSQWPLNDTAVLSFTELVNKVYYDEAYYRNQYPTKAFADFRTGAGRKFIKDSVMPYLSEELQKAISRAETHKIHVYIRAIGNIADPRVMAIFEPYLEGKKQVSQYQRLLMVISLDKLAQTQPALVREVLFKIYQNTAEPQELRVAAVYRLMETAPTTEMMQLMASYTKVDRHEHVNAAVKSIIERLSELKAGEFYNLRMSAEAARPLLTDKVYGVQFGGKYLYEHIIEKLNTQYVHMMKNYGSEDSYFPKGFEHIISTKYNGLPTHFMHIRAYVSSVDELIRVGREQTSIYEDELAQQKHNAEEQKKYTWSSRNIAKLLNLKSEITEQLEATIYNMLPGSPIRMLSLDNRTAESLPEIIRRYQEEFKDGKKINIDKIWSTKDLTMAFPTEMGLPFVYTYKMPVIFQAQGDLKIVSSPDMLRNGKLEKPETINIQTEMAVTVTSKMLGRLGFITPFDHQHYLAGFDKELQIHLPIHGKIDVDIKKGEIKFEMDAVEKHEGSDVFHYSTWPYTSRVDILSVQPVSLQPNTHVIKQEKLRSLDQVIGRKETGLAFRVRYEHERNSIETPLLSELFYKHGFVSGLMVYWNDARIQYSRFDITFLPKESSTKKIVTRMGYQSMYKVKPDEEEQKAVDWKQLRESPDAETLREKIMEKVAEGINNVEVKTVKASLELQGEKNTKLWFAAGYAKSAVDPKSRTVGYYKMTTDEQSIKPHEMTFESWGNFINTNSLDLEYALEQHPKATTDWEVTFGPLQGQKTKLRAELEYSRSEDRKQYLKELPLYQQCKEEMEEGNHQMPSCANLTIAANLLDHTTLKMEYENLERKYVESVKTAYYTLRYNYLPSIKVSEGETSLRENQLEMKAYFHPDFKYVNVSLRSQNERTEFRDIAVSELGKQIFVVHPVFHLPSRLMGQSLELQTYRPMCVVDHTHTNTFSNQSYPVEISKEWTVMSQYVPEVARRFENQESAAAQLERQLENYVVLVRQSPESSKKKEVKIVLSTPDTDFTTADITMKPVHLRGNGPKAAVTINKQKVEFSDRESYVYRDGYIQIYALPNGEVKCEIEGVFYVIYDGFRAKLTALGGKFRDDVRGLCGKFNDYRVDDLTTPEKCIARDLKKFVKSYEVEGEEGQRVRQEFAEGKGCARKEFLYSNVVSESSEESMEQQTGACSISQTKYVEQEDEICFTLRPLLGCESQCQGRAWVTKNVSVHCMRNSNVAQLWKKQIDKGASPDFSHKKEHARIDMQVPTSCSE